MSILIYLFAIMMKAQELKRQDYVLLVKLAQQTQRYEQMVNFADKLFTSQVEMSGQQRKLCSSAYKNVIASRRAELKVIQSISKPLPAKEFELMSPVLEQYEKKIKNQLNDYCFRILHILDETILPSKYQIKSVEAKIFYYKMKADYNRYLCQFNNNHQKYLQTANSTYEEADILARSNLPQTNPVRLSLHLNMSVFLYQRLGQPERAIQLANRTFQDAIANIDTVNQENYKDCTMILQLIRDNISLWNGQNQ